ncbi:c-type cytochrome [Candidatus Pyrohabitans sp.]
MKRGIAVIIAVVLLFLAVGIYNYYRSPSPGGMMGTPYQGAQPPQMQYSSNGEMIYYTGIDERGEQIVPGSAGPMWLYTHGGSCVSCHGEDGRGGRAVMMCSEVPADIRYSALTEEMEHGGEEHEPYNESTVKRAITEGINPAGEELDPCMPRWKMSESDLNDLILFLKELDRR